MVDDSGTPSSAASLARPTPLSMPGAENSMLERSQFVITTPEPSSRARQRSRAATSAKWKLSLDWGTSGLRANA